MKSLGIGRRRLPHTLGVSYFSHRTYERWTRQQMRAGATITTLNDDVSPRRAYLCALSLTLSLSWHRGAPSPIEQAAGRHAGQVQNKTSCQVRHAGQSPPTHIRAQRSRIERPFRFQPGARSPLRLHAPLHLRCVPRFSLAHRECTAVSPLGQRICAPMPSVPCSRADLGK